MNAAEFGALGQGVQGFATAAGLVAAGIWALFIYRDLGRQQTAKIELAAAKQQLEREPAVEFELTPHLIASSGGAIVDFDVTVKNVGSRIAGVDNIFVALIALNPDGTQARSSTKILVPAQRINANLQLENQDTTRFIRPLQSRNIAIPLPSISSGRYLAQLSCIYDGYDIVEGHIEKSADEPIAAIQQTILEVP
jgi:hypothetical protein